jgi:hypothetical protein
MRSLGQPEVLRSAAIAAVICGVVCYPRLSSGPQTYPVWYLESVLVLGSIVLWGFVFAWHTKYTQGPVLTFRIGLAPFLLATVWGAAAALLWHFFLDPFLRTKAPEDFPTTIYQWLAVTSFNLAFTQLFLVFAPFAWLSRLFQRKEIAFVLTVLFGLVVLLLRDHSAHVHFPPAMHIGLLALRLAALGLSVYFFLRGGALLVWWWVLLFQSRHLLDVWKG